MVGIVKAAAWPVAVVVVARGFKPELLAALPAFLRRKIELERFGLKAKVDAAEQQQTAAAENPATEKLPERPAVDPNPPPAVNIIETRLRGELNAVESGTREAVLLRALAQSRLEAGHEFTYNRIFGSQISGLKRLNEVGRATVDDAREFFRKYGEQFPQVYSHYGFDGWLGFLKGNSLVVQTGNILEISDFGRAFLLYLTDRRLSENKPW